MRIRIRFSKFGSYVARRSEQKAFRRGIPYNRGFREVGPSSLLTVPSIGLANGLNTSTQKARRGSMFVLKNASERVFTEVKILNKTLLFGLGSYV